MIFLCTYFFFNSYALIIFNQNNFPSLKQRYLFSDDAFTGTRAGQSRDITAIAIQQIPDGQNQIKPYIFLVRVAVLLGNMLQ